MNKHSLETLIEENMQTWFNMRASLPYSAGNVRAINHEDVEEITRKILTLLGMYEDHRDDLKDEDEEEDEDPTLAGIIGLVKEFDKFVKNKQ